MGTSVTFALDAMPLIRDLHLPVDYSARFVAEGVLLPLLPSDETPAPAAQGPAPAQDTHDAQVPVRCAESVTSYDGGRRWRVRLDGRLRWSDGAPLRAEDAVRGAEHALRRGSNTAVTFLDHSGSRPPAVEVGTRTVEYRFGRPVAFARQLFSTPDFAPLRQGRTAVLGNPSLGPYCVSRWERERITLARNPYWKGLRQGPGAIDFVLVREAGDAVDRYLAGELDMTATTGFGVREVARCAGRGDMAGGPIPVYASLDFGRRAGGFAGRPALRRALSALLDRTALEGGTNGLLLPWAPPAHERHDASGVTLASLRQAVRGGLEIAYSDFAPNAEAAEVLAARLRDALAVPVETVELSYDAYVRASSDRDFSLLYSLTSPFFDHPAGSLSFWRSSGRAARQNAFADAEFDRLLDLAEGCEDPSRADELWRQAEARWWWTVPKIPLAQVQARFLRSPRLAGPPLSPAGLLRFERLKATAPV
ncbi:ABC transporter substrate-binding protein [Streptomyces marispadix]|uniref:ABC transporter substrate-binding protein n=1 Tax=Streptomyces marispadix TaxID=2922868 RepID=A0ABS9SZ88_9ACTN|nr:ABC transporter substrate-binding protein [Streptomyces marispadix]MCH6161599.1 ABC transporter substrate-binding protein [Streptomyces marispadix]